jgi:hypothetical protein
MKYRSHRSRESRHRRQESGITQTTSPHILIPLNELPKDFRVSISNTERALVFFEPTTEEFVQRMI